MYCLLHQLRKQNKTTQENSLSFCCLYAFYLLTCDQVITGTDRNFQAGLFLAVLGPCPTLWLSPFLFSLILMLSQV